MRIFRMVGSTDICMPLQPVRLAMDTYFSSIFSRRADARSGADCAAVRLAGIPVLYCGRMKRLRVSV